MRSFSIIIGLVASMHVGCGPDPETADGQFGAIRSVYINGETKTEESQKLLAQSADLEEATFITTFSPYITKMMASDKEYELLNGKFEFQKKFEEVSKDKKLQDTLTEQVAKRLYDLVKADYPNGSKGSQV